MTGARLSVENVSWTPKGRTSALLHNISFDVAAGSVLGIVGPNGAGKTSLLRMLYRYQRPSEGQIRIDGQDIWHMSARSAAQQVAAVLQEQPSDFALTVAEIVALGRTPHRRGLGGNTGSNDRDIIHTTLHQLDLYGLAHRHLGTLSGGERQRVMVARALAQDPSLLILDEPTNHLDIRHQLEIIDLISALPLTIVTSLHDLNLASDVCDQVLMLHDGHAVQCGPPDDVLTETAVAHAFLVGTRREALMPSNKHHLTFHLDTKGPLQ